jgi:hypothetical protein
MSGAELMKKSRYKQGIIRELTKREKAAKQGLLDGAQILDAVDLCLRSGQRVPPHLATEFCNRLVKYWTYQAESIDQAFDLSRKNQQINKQRQYHALVVPITARIVQRHKAGQAIDFGMYEDVAEEFQLTTSRVKEIYERGKKEMRWISLMFEHFGSF